MRALAAAAVTVGLLAAGVPVVAVEVAGVNADGDVPLYLQAGQPISARVDDLIGRMTLDELIAQLVHWYGASGKVINATFFASGVGQLSMQSSLVQADPLSTIEARNAFQASIIQTSRLHIPVSVAHEGLHSGGEFGTIFPEPCTLGCTWNETLMQAIGGSLADQARAYGVDNTFSPVVNLWGSDGDSRFGRYQEGLSPDPGLTSHLARALVLGLQGGVNDQQDYLPNFNTTVWSTAKHFAGYGSARGGLNGGEFVGNNRSLFEIYLRPWRALSAIGLRGAMPSHNTVLDVPMHAHRYLINGVLRGEFGFGNGSTVSDCSDIWALYGGYGVADNATVAGAMGILAGLDLDLWCGKAAYYGVLNASLAEGLVNLEDIKINVAHVLTQKFAAGLFDQPYTDTNGALERINPPAAQQLALEAAQQGIVVLTNVNNTLPLAVPAGGAGYRVAIIGPHASCDDSNDTAITWFSTYGTSYGPLKPQTEGYANCYGRQNLLGSYILDKGFVDVPLLPDAWKATFPSSTISVTEGAKIKTLTPRPDLIAAAVAAAQAADVAIVVGGDDLGTCGEWVDRDDLDLPGGQIALLQALVNATTTPIVLVLVNGRAVSFGPGNALLGQLAAVVEAWRPGQAGSQAIVDVLTGRINPSGKLANQWVQGVGEIGSGAAPFLSRVVGKWITNNRSAADTTDGREYDNYVYSAYGTSSGKPLFRFGHGLSYTTWEYKSLAVTVNAHPADMKVQAVAGSSASSTTSAPAALPGTFSGRGRAGYAAALNTTVLTAAVTLCNSGKVDGTETVQVYSQDPRGIANSPMAVAPFWKRLLGFGRITLPAGACDTLSIPISADDVAQYDDDMNLRVLPGTYIITAGGRSDQDILRQEVTLNGGPAAASSTGAGQEEEAGLSPRGRLVRGMERMGRA